MPDSRTERPWLSGTGLVKHCQQGLFSPFLTFVGAIFFRPFRLSLAPTICPWVCEDAMELNPKTTELQPIGVQSKLEVRKICMATVSRFRFRLRWISDHFSPKFQSFAENSAQVIWERYKRGQWSVKREVRGISVGYGGPNFCGF